MFTYTHKFIWWPTNYISELTVIFCMSVLHTVRNISFHILGINFIRNFVTMHDFLYITLFVSLSFHLSNDIDSNQLCCNYLSSYPSLGDLFPRSLFISIISSKISNSLVQKFCLLCHFIALLVGIVDQWSKTCLVLFQNIPPSWKRYLPSISRRTLNEKEGHYWNE